MIQNILQLLRDELDAYLTDNVGDRVLLGNIALSTSLNGTEGYMQDTIVISLVNVIEEATLKNKSAYQRYSISQEVENPPKFLNLFLLFSANYNNSGNAGTETPYINALTSLSQVVEFFQSKPVFTVQNSPNINNLQDPFLQDVRIAMHLYSLTFEQVNHLWGSLGGKQLPFVLYEARVLPLRRERPIGRGALIQDVKSEALQKASD